MIGYYDYTVGISYKPIRNPGQSPSRLIYFTESRPHVRGADLTSEMGKSPGSRLLRVPHVDSTNYTCYDGHAGSVSRAQLQGILRMSTSGAQDYLGLESKTE